ncbi:MAG: hypothetical protein WAS21_06780 [Geminicoccaceae bacterium]
MFGGLWLAVDGADSDVRIVQARPLDAGSAGADDAEAVASWLSDDGLLTLAQATSGKRPLADDDAFPGRWAIAPTADRHLAGSPGGVVRGVLVIARQLAGGRTLVTIDTTATTTKPAFALILEEDIG